MRAVASAGPLCYWRRVSCGCWLLLPAAERLSRKQMQGQLCTSASFCLKKACTPSTDLLQHMATCMGNVPGGSIFIPPAAYAVLWEQYATKNLPPAMPSCSACSAAIVV